MVEVRQANSASTMSIALERMANDIFAHKRQMFDVLSRLEARACRKVSARACVRACVRASLSFT